MRSMTGEQTTLEAKARFLRVLRDTGSLTVACQAIGRTRLAAKRWREEDDDFNEQWTEAELDAADALEQEARRRAVEGVTRTRSVKVGPDKYVVEDETVYSDTLLLKLLEANNPAKFTNRSKTEISNPDGSLTTMDESSMAARLSSILAIAAARAAEGKQ